MEFKNAIEHILISEGGYVNDPTDLGGETNYGITKRFYKHLDIKNLTKKEASEIYYNDYWLKAKCDQLPEDLRLIHFDTAVNMGITRANKFLQEAIGVRKDGVIGQVTLSQAHKADILDYTRVRLVYYTKIIISKPEQIKYINGWYNRVLNLL